MGALALVAGLVWMPAVFGGNWVSWLLAFVLGTISTVIMSATAGTLYGIESWRLIASMIVTDSVLRLVSIVLTVTSTNANTYYGWAIVAPIPITLLAHLPWLIRAIRNKSEVDTTYKNLGRNASQTIIASIATGVLVSGFPAALGASNLDASANELGQIIFAVTLARAPLIVTVMALQSFLVVQFRKNSTHPVGLLFRIGGIVVTTTLLASVMAYFVGIPILNYIAGQTIVTDGALMFALVFSSGLVALLQVTGSYLVAESRHTAYFLGMVIAAVSTIGLLAVDLDTEGRVMLSLVAAPALGLATHLVIISARGWRIANKL